MHTVALFAIYKSRIYVSTGCDVVSASRRQWWWLFRCNHIIINHSITIVFMVTCTIWMAHLFDVGYSSPYVMHYILYQALLWMCNVYLRYNYICTHCRGRAYATGYCSLIGTLSHQKATLHNLSDSNEKRQPRGDVVMKSARHMAWLVLVFSWSMLHCIEIE